MSNPSNEPIALPNALSPLDYIMFRMDEFPAARASGIGVFVLDRAPDWDRLCRVFERGSRLFARLRQRVVEPVLPVTGAHWAVDPDFDLGFHVRRVSVSAPGSVRQLLDLGEMQMMLPYDRARPLWDVLLVEGLEDGRAGLIARWHHCLTDGLGAIQLANLLYDTEREAQPGPMPPLPVPEDLTPEVLTRSALRRLPETLGRGLFDRLGDLRDRVGEVVRAPGESFATASEFVESARRVMRPPPVEPSPILRRRGLVRHFEVIDLPLADLKRAAHAAAGSINDVYLAGLAGVLRRYHEALGVEIEALPAGIPISTRREDDPAAGNHFAGALLALPIGERDPRARVKAIRELVLAARNEPAIGATNITSSLFQHFPQTALRAVSQLQRGIDVQASNVPGPREPWFIAGAEILRNYPFGPLPGPAMMTVLYSQAGQCTIGVNCDAAAIADRTLFVKCLEEGFDEMLALGRETSGDAAKSRTRRPRRGDAKSAGASGRKPRAADDAHERASRRPGTVAEIEASPAGPQTAAFFDFDGTLIEGYSGEVFARDRFRRRDVSVAEIQSTARSGLEAALGRSGFAEFLKSSVSLSRGRPLAEFVDLGERLYAETISKRVYAEARALVEAHRRRGHTIVITTSAVRYQVAAAAADLGIDHVLCNELVSEQGLLTGEVVEPILWGPGKARAAQRFAGEHKIDLARSYFYADGDEDAALMHVVGNPRPTNPHSGLRKLAQQRGWPVLEFEKRPKIGLSEAIRTLAGTASLLPAALGGIAVAAAKGDVRTGVEYASTRWFDTMFAVNGVRFRVQGESHLRAPRPAVFIWNHANGFDPLMASKLVRENFTGVAKQEISRDPLMGTLGRLGGGAFVDRADSKKAVAALEPLERALSEGISVLVAPEGTRHGSGGLGPFKKGAFRMAMKAGVPIIPIVFRNALDVAKRDERVMRAATVDVAVLEPISVAEWRADDLEERIEQVRRRFLETLSDWPDEPFVEL